jgi:hypothetical protein
MKKKFVLASALVLLTLITPVNQAQADDKGAPMTTVNTGNSIAQKQAGQKQAKQKNVGQKNNKSAPTPKPERVWVHQSSFTCVQGDTVIHVSDPSKTCPQGFKKK